MKNILVPVNDVSKAITNTRYAVHLASISGAKVYLVNTYKEFSKVGALTKVNQLIVEDSEEILDQVLKEVDTKGVEILPISLKGDPFEGIKRISQQLEIDLLILSPQSVEIVDELYLGNITGKLVKQTEIPVLLVPKDYIFRKIETILLAFKNGQVTEDAVKPLKELAGFFSAKINLLQVETPDMAQEETPLSKVLEDIQDTYTQTKNATIYQGVLEHFQSSHPDLLCVFRRNRGFFTKLWEKNTISKKDFHTTKPLLILKGVD